MPRERATALVKAEGWINEARRVTKTDTAGYREALLKSALYAVRLNVAYDLGTSDDIEEAEQEWQTRPLR